jgi:hypothetical protein
MPEPKHHLVHLDRSEHGRPHLQEETLAFLGAP